MKAIVTGGAGFIGSHLVDKLINLGHEVTVIDNLSTGKEENINPKANFIQQDLRMLSMHLKADVLFHLAAQIDVRKSITDPEEDVKQNILAGINLLKCVNAQKIVFTSSGGAVYGEAKNIPTRESEPTNPTSPYGMNKLYFENYLLHSHKNVSIARLSNVYGPRQDGSKESGVIAIFIRDKKNKKISSVFGQGHQTRDFIHVYDVVRALISMSDINKSNIYNIGTGKETSVKELMRIVGHKYSFYPAIKGEVKRSCLECSKAKRHFGWSPKIKLETGVNLLLCAK